MVKFKDLSGKKFGKLTVIRATDKRTLAGTVIWECRCDCGNIAYVSGTNLKSGHTKSCGCTREEKFKKYREKKKFDLIGQRFGRLVVIENAGTDKNHNSLWKCKCNCGNVVVTIGRSLILGLTKSCGCISRDNLETLREKNSIEHTNIAIVKGLLNNNKSKITKSGVKGVCWSKREKKWRTYIMIQGKLRELGYFSELEDAIKARKEVEERLFRPFLEEHKKFYIKMADECIKIWKEVLNGERSRFPHRFWCDINQVQLKGLLIYFFEYVLKWDIGDIGYIKDNLNAKLFKEYRLNTILNTFFDSSPYETFNFVYPNKIKRWDLNRVGKTYWTKKRYVKAAKYVIEKEGWTEEDIRMESIYKLFNKYNIPTISMSKLKIGQFDLINAIYPGKFKEWEFNKVGANYWNIEKGKQAVKWLVEEKLKWNKEEIKQNLTHNIFRENGLYGMLYTVFNGNIYNALNITYPGKFKKEDFKRGHYKNKF